MEFDISDPELDAVFAVVFIDADENALARRRISQRVVKQIAQSDVQRNWTRFHINGHIPGVDMNATSLRKPIVEL